MMVLRILVFALVKPEKSRLVPAPGRAWVDKPPVLYNFLYNEAPMSVVTYSYARQNLAKLMDEAERDRAPIYISRRRKRGAAVLISLEDYEAMETTLYLLGNPTNAKLLREGIAELDSGRGVKHNTVPAVRRSRKR
jgi:antitoxin YefM